MSENVKFFLDPGFRNGETTETTFRLYERQAGTKPPRVEEGERDKDRVVIDSGDRLIRKRILEQRAWDAWVLSGAP